MHGPLHEIGLVDVLLLLERGQRSGVLRVVGPDPTKPRVLELNHGRITSIEPDCNETAIDEALVTQSLGSRGSERQTPLAVRETVRAGLARGALDTMATWTRGRFDFEEGISVGGALDLLPGIVVRELVEAEQRREELAGILDSFRVVPDFPSTENAVSQLPPHLGPLDWRLLDVVDGVRTVAAIAARIDEPVEVVGERVLAMLAETILVLRPAAAEVDVAARAAVQSGRYQEAADQLRSRVATVPQDQEAWRLLGLAEVGAGRFDHAIEAWTAWRSVAGPRAPEADSLIVAARTMLEAMREHRE